MSSQFFVHEQSTPIICTSHTPTYNANSVNATGILEGSSAVSENL